MCHPIEEGIRSSSVLSLTKKSEMFSLINKERSYMHYEATASTMIKGNKIPHSLGSLVHKISLSVVHSNVSSLCLLNAHLLSQAYNLEF